MRLRGVPALVALVVAGIVAVPAMAAPGEDDTPIGNPDLPLGCGIDIHVILDESGSIANSGATGDVRRAFGAFTSALKNTGSRMAVSEFSTVARLPLAGAASRSYTTVTDATIASTFEPYITKNYNPSGSTDWEDAFRVGRYFLPRPSPQIPHLVVFITDGNPNVIVRNDRVTYDPGNPNQAQNEYELKVPLASDETTSANEDPAKDRAVSNANALKAQGSHILSVAVGDGLDDQDSLDRIIDVSGPDVFTGTGTFDLATDDVYRVPNFSELEDAMREAAFQLCAPSVNVRKLVDIDPDPAAEDLQPGQDWSMTASVAPPPAAWVLPAGATGSTATGTTGPDGFVNFQWTTAAPTSSTITVTEVVQQGYFNDPAATRCTFRTPDTPNDRPLPGFSATTGGFTGTVPDEAIVTCEMVNRITPAPAVDIEKSTNGDDADVAPGPFVPVGSPVNWTYRVTNTGNVPLSGIAVTDNQGVTVTCPQATLAPGAFMVCTASGTSVAGQYTNTGAVTATGAGQAVTDSDPSHYVGVAPGIDIEKATNGADADFAPGPIVSVGAPVVWTYVVTNTGNAPLTGVTVTDSEGVVVTCPQATLAVGESITCTAPAAAAVAGQYENRGDVIAQSPVGPVQDSDASHYFGELIAIELEKFVNAQDADTAPGVLVAVGQSVAWTFRFTNTGNVPLVWSLTDPQFTGLACPRIQTIAPGQSLVCFGPIGARAQAGQHTNVGTVRGESILSAASVTDTDPANYFGVDGDITLEKFTNGVDADQAPGPFLPLGSVVNWTYLVTNTGNSDLTDIAVTDFRGVAVTCPVTTLAPGASTTCTGSGTAAADQYTNLARVTALTPVDTEVSDVDPSHYFGATPGIHLEKDTNGVDADDPADAPFIPVGNAVTWTYVATNTGNAPLTGVAVSDDRGVTVTCPQTTLAAGEEMSCTATGTATIGAYDNTGTVTGTDPTSATVSDDDPSHYFGSVSAIRVKKFTNGADADAPPGPDIEPGAPVTWTYQVTNPGNVSILSVTVTDDKGVVPVFTGGDADRDTELDPGETWSYRATGTATPGQYANTATARGLDVLEQPVSDTDPSHYLAELAPPQPSPKPKPDLRLRKKAMAKRVRADDTMRFRLRVRNVGDGAARNVKVCDRLPQGLVLAAARGARVRAGRACFTVRRLAPGRSRTFTVRVWAKGADRARTLCNVATRTARGVALRRARACVRVLPAAAGQCPAVGAVARQARIADRPRAYAAC